ncbi:MAG: DNA replication and repair protein RecF, partial [Rikenellaceae bacterium]
YASMLDSKPMDELLKHTFVRDCACGHTTTGISRDDLKMKIDGYPLKRFGSQGQQKSFVIAMKLAQYDIMARAKSSKPILLLDDIFDRLDSDRVKALLELVSDDKFGQIFITDCDRDRIFRVLENQNSEYRIFEITNGVAEWKRNIR